MKNFDYYLDKLGEIGFVEEVMHSIVTVSGLPEAHPEEVVIFESGDVGQILSINEDSLEILILSKTKISVGSKVVRTGGLLQVPVGNEYLGRVIDSLGNPIDKGKALKGTYSPIDTQPHGIVGRKQIDKPLETGVTSVDLVVPLAKGQRELVIGDRKTGKTQFLLQSFLNQARKGTICIYAVIGQRQIDIKKHYEFIQANKIQANSMIIATSSSDPSGLIFLTPYTAMTYAEFFRDKGMDVLLVLDDMTSHARYYREISLLAKRFPGRSSYPGDIFYSQARLLERAGNFKTGSITCLPVAESVLGDLSGYIQTNLMAMTDGHIFFDIDLYNQGKRPAVSPYLSVTRVGRQAQTSLQKDLGRQLSSFLVSYDRMQQFMHFGAEVGESVKRILDLGSKVDLLFSQVENTTIPVNANIVILAGLSAGVWNETGVNALKKEMEQVILNYQTNAGYKKQVDSIISTSKQFSDLVNAVRQNNQIVYMQK
jgi:F-type H+-transporting ATPase subunit alpha